jgi:hypothetical protein
MLGVEIFRKQSILFVDSPSGTAYNPAPRRERRGSRQLQGFRPPLEPKGSGGTVQSFSAFAGF